MNRVTLSLAFLAFLAGVVGCNKTADIKVEEENPWEEMEAQPILLSKAEENVAASANTFGLEVFRQLVSAQKGEDVLFSPFGLSLNLSLCAGGGEAETKSQILSTLGFSKWKADDVASYFKSVSEGLLCVDPSSKFLCANSVWVDKNYTLEDAFKDYASDSFKAELTSLDLLKKESLGAINRWCADHTEGKIAKVVDDSRDPEVRSVSYLLNALYFNGGWQFPFDEKPQEGTFHGQSGDRLVSYLQNEEHYQYYETEKARLVSLPYGNCSYSLVVALPKDGIGLSEMMNSLDAMTLFTGSRHDVIRLRLPKFEMEYNTGDELVPVLKKLGMTVPFQAGQADFSSMFKGSAPFYIEKLFQKTVITVDEKGTEAAAATFNTILMSNGETNPPVLRTLTVDRPFAFALVENTSKTILFLGQKVL